MCPRSPSGRGTGWRPGFRSIVSGDAATPDWVRDLENGHDEGYFGPDSAVWVVHGDLATLVGGVRALLVQALHPAAVTGVDEHSTYREDPLGRLAGTTRWLTVTTFGSRSAADRECARVRGMHRRVQGTYTDADGVGHGIPRRRRAPAGLGARGLHRVLPRVPRDVRRADPRRTGRLRPASGRRQASCVGLAAPPRSAAELRAQMATYEPELTVTPATERTIAFLRNPPLPAAALVGYQVLFAAAASTLQERHRELLGLPRTGGWTSRAAARTLLAGMRSLLGEGPPAPQPPGAGCRA